MASGKDFHDTSSRELPASSGPNAYAMDDLDNEDADNYHAYKGVTRHDHADMTRMGKVQELKVGH